MTENHEHADPLGRLAQIAVQEDSHPVELEQLMPPAALSAFELWRSLDFPSVSRLARVLNLKPSIVSKWKKDYDWDELRVEAARSSVPSFQEALSLLAAMRLPVLMAAFDLAMNGEHEIARANLLRDLMDRAGMSPEIVQSILAGDLTPGNWDRADLDNPTEDPDELLRRLRSSAPR